MRIVDVYESTMCQKDSDFKNEEAKEEYYKWEFWQDADYVLIPERDNYITYFKVDWDNKEIIVNDEEDCDEIDSIILDFVKDNHEDYFEELMVGTDYKVEDDPKYDPEKPYIKYRGGSGYGYYHHQYKNNKIFNTK